MAAYEGLILFLLGLLVICPLSALIVWPQEARQVWWFLLPGGSLAALGALLWWSLRPKEPVSLSTPEGAVIIVFAWAAAMLVGAVPLMGCAGLNFSQAVFEATSGWTTTGLSVVDVTKASHLILLHRSIMQLAGGAGLAILMLAAFGGPLGVGLSAAEGKETQLVPHMRRSTRLVVSIYAAYALTGILALRLAGMDWFDAVNHSFCAVSTGGFSTRPESIGYWNSPLIEAVTIPLMILGNLNFLTTYALLRGKWRAVLRNGEVRLMAFLLPVGISVLFICATAAMFPSLGKSLRVAIFETVSALTTTGYSTVDYKSFNAAATLMLITLMLVGGGICSTAGGIKQFRIYMMWRTLLWEFRRLLLPRNAVSRPQIWGEDSREPVDDASLRQIGVFIFLYLVLFLSGAVLLGVFGFSLSDSLFEFASALGTVGLSVGVTSQTTPSAALWAETLAMLLGRLEFLVVGIGLVKIIQDGRWMVKVVPTSRK
ncbi:MAG: TrkH family potassium uptake protein [Proteobacteria bacterium]|nr:TrkH family potassium uptake protein [Pseudomonadota bacterium]MBU4597370.1 TrkH family potassium uptake protein [Pseudomonadota bacterium]